MGMYLCQFGAYSLANQKVCKKNFVPKQMPPIPVLLQDGNYSQGEALCSPQTGLQFVLGHAGNVDFITNLASTLAEKTTNSVLMLVPQLKSHVIEFLCINHHGKSLSKLRCYYTSIRVITRSILL